MVSTGFDGTIRKWNLKNFQMEAIFEERNTQGRDKIYQHLAWCLVLPPKGQPIDAFANIVAACTSAGTLKLVDLAKNKILQTLQVVSNGDFLLSLDWNSAGHLAIGNTTKTVYIKKFDPVSRSFSDAKNLPLQSPTRCVAWNPMQPHLLACGTFDGRIVIYDQERDEITQQLKSTQSRILCLQWHPHFDYIIAAGSFDNIVRVLDIKMEGFKELTFHTDRVRSLMWSTEIPWMLTSGADDSRQAVWDIRSRVMIYSTEEPSLALTSFTLHPERPFTYYSSHFDASII